MLVNSVTWGIEIFDRSLLTLLIANFPHFKRSTPRSVCDKLRDSEKPVHLDRVKLLPRRGSFSLFRFTIDLEMRRRFTI